jgi:hypothetical protein
MGESLFRSFHREGRWLSNHLADRFTRGILGQVQGMNLEELTATDAEMVATGLVAKVRVEAPALGGTEQGRVREHGGAWRLEAEAPISRVPTTRFYVAIEVFGDAELLEWWPDQADSGALVPVDQLSEPDPSDAVRKHLAGLRNDQWFLGTRTDAGPTALYTFVDLTPHEVGLVAEGKLSPRAAVDQERTQIEPIVTAIAKQTNDFFDVELPGLVTDYVETRVKRLKGLSAVAADLRWPEGFRFPAPKIEQSASTAAASHLATDLGLEFRPRLASATFDDTMRTVRIWGNAVERYPASYALLGEERLSDQLAATLNAALPGAQREVYTRAGKSDLFVRADAIDTGASHARVFIGECKWWDGPERAADAYRQLHGYLEVKDNYCLLLFFSKNVDGAKVRADALGKMRDLGGEPIDDASPVDGWPYLSFKENGRDVTLCLAVLDMPPPK